MKRVSIILLIAVSAARVFAQADAVALAAQREAEENLKRMSATIEVVQTSQEAQQKQVGALAAEVEKLRGEVARANNNAATMESLKKLNEQILKVDESRIADNRRIQEALEKLAKLIAERPSMPPVRPVDRPPPVVNPVGPGTRPAGASPEEGFDYVIQSGDRLDIIVKAYRDQHIMVTTKAIMDANPTVNWSKLRIGQKIFIPKPK